MNELRLSLRLLLVAFAATMLSAIASASDNPRVLEPRTGFRVSSDSALPPPADAAWVPVRLPENRGSFRLASRPPAVWYRIEFDAPQDLPGPGSWAVYVPYLLDGGRFFLNGKPLAHLAEPSDQMHVKWERPHLLPVTEGMVQAGKNVLMVRTQPAPTSVSLEFSRIAFGPAADLLPTYERRLFWVRTVPLLTSAFCLIVGLYVLFVWLRRRSEVLYGLFALTILAWGVRTMTFVIETLPSPAWLVWRFFFLSATGAFIGLLTVFMLRFAGLRSKWFERLLLLYWLIAPIAMIASAGAADGWIDRVWRNGWALLTFVMLGAMLTAAWRQRSWAAYAMLAGTLLVVTGGIHDTLQYSGALERVAPEWSGHRLFLMHHGANVLLLVMGGIFTQRFVQSLFEVEALNQSLEARVAAREAELAQSYRQLALLEGERAAVEERKRIMQDIHDGLGSQLFTSLLRAERGALAQPEMTEVLRSCIAEMRLALEATALDGDDFFAALADFRFRWEALLTGAGILSSWQVDASDDPLKLPAHTTLELLRILQEALTNTLKHSRASHVHVRLLRRQDHFRIEVEDDGTGMEGDKPGGRGLANMRARAKRLRSELEVRQQPGRTLLGLSIPTGG